MLTRDELYTGIEKYLLSEFKKSIQTATTHQLHDAIAHTVIGEIAPFWDDCEGRHNAQRRAYYLSAEFLMGRAVFNNLYCLGILNDVKEILSKDGRTLTELEDIEDAALGNGGLGRLAACFLDSAATCDIPLNGYGIRYRYGLFKQSIKGGFQCEEADKWLTLGKDAWGIRCEEDAVTVQFADQTVTAVPYDTPIIGYGLKAINTLRLWQSEPINSFNFGYFDNQDYTKASEEEILANAITNVLYPNDNTEKGLQLRLKQQYFFASASLQDILRRYKNKHGKDFSKFAESYAIQLNDTHPTIAIPELIRLLMFKEGMPFKESFSIAQKTFNYTNHTVMAEALEKWDMELFRHIVPTIYEIIGLINEDLKEYLTSLGQTDEQISEKSILDSGRIHMARMAIYSTSHTNGVAEIHTEILKNDVLKEWYDIFPERFQNKTNGITPRRWLGLCNPELSESITEKLKTDQWLTDLSLLKKLEWFADDSATLEEFNKIKTQKKVELSEYICKNEDIILDPTFIFDIQVKRLHEYKRQLLNAFSIMDIYFQIKAGKLPNFVPTAFIFGAKAAPAYRRAKGIIKYINEVAKLVNNDPDTCNKMAVVFIQNYNVSYAEKLIPAADFSQQISTAGTEASGTGNMKFMLNGAVTIGTWDGANIEIANEAGIANEYIFGAKIEELESIKKTYRPKEDYYYKNERLKKVMNTLVDGTFNDGDTGMFYDLHKSLTDGFSWHKGDNYYLCKDFESYCDTRIRANSDYSNRKAFAKKCWLNIANSGKFSSDRTVTEYAEDLWELY